jgi:hypothetical protein
VSTAAYGTNQAVLADLRGLDTQSHGHFHHVYRDEASNRRNLDRAHAILRGAGIEPVAFAAPGGRWNVGLGRAVEALGYRYGSEFQLGYDDVPFVPRGRGRVLQIPVHPICEGLFLDAGETDPKSIARHYAQVIRERVEARQPAFVYGHPERRLGRMPEVIAAIASEVENESTVWKTTLTEFAHWWQWRLRRRWSVHRRGPGRYEARFEDDDQTFRPQIEIVHPDREATIEAVALNTSVALDQAHFEPRSRPLNRSGSRTLAQPWSLRRSVREAIDWEKVTPTGELASGTVRLQLKRGLRRLQAARKGQP